MNQIRILVGALPEFERSLVTYLNTQVDLRLIRCCRDGAQLAEAIQAAPVDIIVAELALPSMDALGVLERVRLLATGERPQVVVVSPCGSEAVIRRLQEAGAAYCLLKPVNLELLGARIRQLVPGADQSPRPVSYGAPALAALDLPELPLSVEMKVARLLLDVGLSDRRAGFHYLCRAIDLVAQNESLLGRMTKVVYPAVATEFDSTPARVERSIRGAIGSLWSRGAGERVKGLFASKRKRGKPSNAEFIAMLADRLRSGAD